MATTEKQNRGFRTLTLERRREIASKGGRAVHAKGTAHQWTAEEAGAAARKGSVKRWPGERGKLVEGG